MLCFYSDSPNVLKSLKRKLKQDVNPALVNIGECTLHKVHNAFAKRINAFGDNCYFEDEPKVPDDVLLRHVSSRWLTLGPALERFIEQYPALKAIILHGESGRSDGTIYKHLQENLGKKDFLPKAIFLRNVADLFVDFLTMFQRSEPLLHVLYQEMVSLGKKILGRFLRVEVYRDLTGEELKSLDVGGDTETALSDWTAEEKKLFRLGARSFYMKAASYLISKLPFDNVVNLAQQVPQVIAPTQVSALIDEFTQISTEALHCDPHERLDEVWQRIFSLKNEDGAPRYGEDASRVQIKPELIKAVESSYKCYQERLAAEDKPAAKKSKRDEDGLRTWTKETRRTTNTHNAPSCVCVVLLVSFVQVSKP
ncbi:hypothetical protein HPB47_012320 [Ixodes persulcatus]|uniref:Uncharacterized protein n=1 Tax=Ixodes persulcatus TaxID=34615 RepID=A0AC60NU48_IXOPE|nr:hypothetical protein HPB47_012320 [Ixodes persulcatus]